MFSHLFLWLGCSDSFRHFGMCKISALRARSPSPLPWVPPDLTLSSAGSAEGRRCRSPAFPHQPHFTGRDVADGHADVHEYEHTISVPATLL